MRKVLPLVACLFGLVNLGAAVPSDVQLSASRQPGGITIVAAGSGMGDRVLFVALGGKDHAGSLIVPYGKGTEGSTVFLPFRAAAIVRVGPDGVTLRRWEGTRWGERAAADLTVVREAGKVSVTLPADLVPPEGEVSVTAYVKDLGSHEGWGTVVATADPVDPKGAGDQVLRGFWRMGADGAQVERRGGPAKTRIYQFLPRHFGNTNETRKPNGTIEENGTGKFSDLNETSLAALKAMGFTHVWPTGVLQQATATDYSALGEPADDPDLLKGLAGSPYAIKDYFDVCPDYADDPARRVEEFRAMVDRVHAAGMKVLIDFVPNHVARSHASSVRPDLSFGAGDDRTVFFRADNNFFWLTPEAKPFGHGPPLRLPTVDADGHPVSPTSKVAKAKSDGLFGPETEHGRVTGSNLASWEPDLGSWYETVKLNYGYNFLDPTKQSRLYPHGSRPDLPIPDTWKKMDEIIAYWQGLGVDGFRVDMAHLVPPEFWHWMIARARSREPEVFFVAEAYDTDPAKVPAGDPLVAEVGGGNVMFDLLNAGFDAVYDDATYDKVKDIYERGAWANDLDGVLSRPLVFDNSLRYAENHDEVRLAARSQWGGTGKEVGRPVTALLFALSRGPVMLYSGQEVGEPADGVEGFGEDDARTSIFDYWAMPELAKWVNDKKFDGGRLAPDQVALRSFYARLLEVVSGPAFHQGAFFPLNPANRDNPRFGRLPGETVSGHWLYAFLRADPVSGQKFLVVINLHPDQSFDDVRVVVPREVLAQVGLAGAGTLRLEEKLSGLEAVSSSVQEAGSKGIALNKLPPLTPAFFAIQSP